MITITHYNKKKLQATKGFMQNSTKKISIIAWLYHNDLADEFFDLLYPLEDLVNIHLCLCQDNNNLNILSKFNSLNSIQNIRYYPNVGADLYSFINTLPDIKTEYFIKIHSKKSLWGVNNKCNWRAMLLDSLIGNRDTLIDNVKYMNKYSLGSIGCRPLIYKDVGSVHSYKVNDICQIIGLVDHPKNNLFVGGNMFMGRTKTYQNYLNENTIELLNNLLELECGKIKENKNGTYSHALERVLGYIGNTQSLKSCPFHSFRIKVLDNQLVNKTKYLHIRKMYNNEIYCIEQPNLYGRVNDDSKDSEIIQIFWKHKQQEILATYQKISQNTYINKIHLTNRANDKVY